MARTKKPIKSIIALRKFTITQNEYHFVIAKGDDIIKLGIPEKFYPNLVTEKVIEELK